MLRAHKGKRNESLLARAGKLASCAGSECPRGRGGHRGTAQTCKTRALGLGKPTCWSAATAALPFRNFKGRRLSETGHES